MNGTATLDVKGAIPRVDGDEPLFEIIDGQKVEIPHMGAFASIVASRLLGHLFGQVSGHGQAVVETLFHLPLPLSRNRRPDLAFVSYERWAKDRAEPKEDNAWDVVPDLVAEVVSSQDEVEELMEKVEEYFRAGVRLVWILFPKQALVHEYESFTQVRILTRAEVLKGGRILPEFELPLSELFGE